MQMLSKSKAHPNYLIYIETRRKQMKEKNKKRKKLFFNLILIGGTFGAIMWGGITEQKENKKEEPKYEIQNTSTEQEVKEETPITIPLKEYPKEKIEEEYRGYTVAAKLEIPSIELKTYVLKNYSKQALNIAVTKFWGADANQKGNFCIAGHNFPNRNMFHHLKDLEIGETFTISDNLVGKVEYKIYDIYKVMPEEVACLSQNTNGKKEVTLITCTSDSVKRIIVKAEEK